MKLNRHLVEKPWGRTDIPAAFGDMGDKKIGEIWYEGAGEKVLPILVKWLFTSERLSIQVHPNDMQAAQRGQASGKEECWYIVDAQPGAVLGIGTKQPLTAVELRDASLSGEIENLMDWKAVRAGDYFYIPAGTVHAIGAGITLVEVQQYSDITYRLYDFGRPRELHLDDGVAVASARPYCDIRSGHAAGNIQLVDGPHFRLWSVSDADALAALPSNIMRWVVPVKGGVKAAAEAVIAGECLLVEPGVQLTMTGSAHILIAA